MLPEDPVIGIAKSASPPIDNGDGTFDTTITLLVENLGSVPLSNVQVTDDLTATFPAPATFSIQSGPTATGTLVANGGYDGSADVNLLISGSSSLAVGSTSVITFTVRFDPNGLAGPFFNTAAARFGSAIYG